MRAKRGTGKSHLVEALGHVAIDRGKTVAWHTLETLAQLVRRHRADDSVNKAIGKLIRSDLVVIDDVGLLPVSNDAAEALYNEGQDSYRLAQATAGKGMKPWPNPLAPTPVGGEIRGHQRGERKNGHQWGNSWPQLGRT